MKSRTLKSLLLGVLLIASMFCLYGCGDKTEASIDGTVKEYTGEQLTITTSDNTELTFDVADATVECTNGIESGNSVSVIYTGEIDGADTSKVTVVKIIDCETNEPATTDPTADTSLETVQGTVEEATMNSMTIKTDDEGVTLTFTTTYAEKHYKNGIKVGNHVSIKYKGTIEGTDTSKVKVIAIYDDAANAQHEADNDVHNITGTVTDGTTNTVTIKDSNGDEYTFTITNAKKYIKNGIVIGNTVTIKYVGSLTKDGASKLKVISITDGDANASANTGKGTNTEPAPTEKTSTITGTVVDASMSNVVIKTDDGKELDFATGDAEHHYKNGIQIGNSVTITYTGAINDTNTDDVKVISVTDTDANATSTSSTTDSEDSHTVIGTVDAATTMDNLVLDVDGGSTLSFSLDNATVNCAHGLGEGEKVSVTYTGSVDPAGGDPVAANSVDDAE